MHILINIQTKGYEHMNPAKRIINGLFLITATLLFLLIYEHFSEEGRTVLAPAAVNSDPAAPLTIGWSVYNSDYEFFHTMQDGLITKANELGMQVITHNQNSSTSEMISGVSNLISQGIDALVISPFNPEVMSVISAMTNNAGIPLIIVDIGTDESDYDAFIVSDSYGGGVLAAEYALNLIKSKDIQSKNAAIIETEKTAVYASLRGDAFRRVMADAGYTIVSEIRGDSREDLGYEAMKEILSSYGDDLVVVFSENDRMALGAARALKEAGKSGEILLIGFDGDTAAIDAIKEGLMQGTIAQRPYEMGQLGAETVYNILTDKPIAFDDRLRKMLLVEVSLIDESGNPSTMIP